jgi:hypothetical protein
MAKNRFLSEVLELPGSPLEIFEDFYERGWTDGLPIIPPTEDLVEATLAYTDRGREEEIGKIPVRYAPLTVEKVAINAVMAGCRPEYLPVLITGMEAMLEDSFGLYSQQATTHPCAPLLIVNGPVINELDMNYSSGCFGPTNRANATIGRAVRLLLLNIGGAHPGAGDMATHGEPSKYSSCIPENEEENPWEPFHVEHGFARDVNTVTVLSAEAGQNVNNHESVTAEGMLKSLALAGANSGSNDFVYCNGHITFVLGPEHASTIAAEGVTKQEVRDYIWENCRIDPLLFSDEQQERLFGRQTKRFEDNPSPLRAVPSKDRIVILVAGGPGKHSQVVHSFGINTVPITKAITKKDGSLVKSMEEFRS